MGGRILRDPGTLKRIKSLAVPPAWSEVWICPLSNGHLQATGRDARGRKQHRYHLKWREVRDETKYKRMMTFARGLPKIRRRVSKDLKLPGLPRDKVLATVVKLLEVSLIRVGNEEYANNNGSYGLTTMLDRHAKVNGSKVQFRFRGKGGKNHTIDVENPRLAKIVKNCQDLPGQELFQYIDGDGKQQDVKSEDVNEYLRAILGGDFTAKDFRTWAGTVLAAMALSEVRKFDSKAQAKKNIVNAIEKVAQRLGNTPAICRKCYIHPAVIDSYIDGATLDTVGQRAEDQLRTSVSRLRPEEASVLALLQQRARTETSGRLLRHQLRASLKARKRRRT
jgi:DNA topoisomerase-1